MSYERERERRLQPRVEKVQLVQVSTFDEEGFHQDMATGRTLNMSWGGVRVELRHPLPLRSVVNLSLAMGDQMLELEGRVVYLQTLDEQRCAMGIEFLDMSQEDADALNDYLASQST